MPRTPRLPLGIDTSRPNPARVYDALLGGKDNFEVDREFCQQVLRLVPESGSIARSNRRWLADTVQWLAREAGIDQFLDLGSGLPTVQNTHEVAQAGNENATVVYVDNDPTVIAHGRALLHDDQHTFFCAGDLTDPSGVLSDPVVTAHLDLDRPVALLNCLTLHHVADSGAAAKTLEAYTSRLASGSHVAVTHVRQLEDDSDDARRLSQALTKYREAAPDLTPRPHNEIAAMLDGLELAEPGIAPVGMWWRAGDDDTGPSSYPANLLVGALGLKR